METKIQVNYTSRDYVSIRQDLINYLRTFFPDQWQDFNVASPGMALVELNAYVGDLLSYLADKKFNELFLDGLTERVSAYRLAKTLGYKVPGVRPAISIMDLSIEVPVTADGPDLNYTPILRPGLQLRGGGQVLFGIKTGGWGDLVIPAGKTLSLVGLNSPRYPGITAQIGSITFSPTTGANPNLNELHLANLYIIAPAGSSAITFGGTAPARLRADGCYIYSNTVTGIVISNTNATFSSAVFQDCEIQSSTSTNTHVTSACRLVTFSRCVFNNGNKAVDVTGGILEIGLSRLEVNSAGAIVTASSGALAPTYVSLGNCLIYNTTANGSGISLTQGAQSLTFINVSNVFNILAGTGYCVTGTGTHAYSYPTFAGTNVKFRNTLTNVPLTTTPTLAP